MTNRKLEISISREGKLKLEPEESWQRRGNEDLQEGWAVLTEGVAGTNLKGRKREGGFQD